ncbi:MAG: flagellar basal body-associated protein FliL [Syntrophothermus sp.]
MAVVILVALAGGGAGGWYLFAPKKPKAEPKPEPGIVVALDPVTINLAEGHYLKLGFALQATTEVEKELDGSKALDIAIDLYSNRSVAELSSNEERKRTKKELKEKIIKAYDEKVMDVYYTSFVMQ